MKVNIDKKIVNWVGMLFLVVLIGLLVFDGLRKGIFSNTLGMDVAVVGNNSVALMLLRPEEGLITWVDLPDNMKINIFNSTASYPIVSLWKYSTGEKNSFDLFEKSLGTTLGVTLPRTIKVDGEANIETVLGNLHKLSLKTDLSLRDKWTIRSFVADVVKSKKMIEETIPKKAFDEVTEPDGKIFLKINSVASLWVNNKFVMEPILSESAEVTVNNMTGISGYGTEVANQIESAGLRVVEVKADKTEAVSGSGCIFSISDGLPQTEKYLVDYLSCHKLSNTKQGSGKGTRIWLK